MNKLSNQIRNWIGAGTKSNKYAINLTNVQDDMQEIFLKMHQKCRKICKKICTYRKKCKKLFKKHCKKLCKKTCKKICEKYARKYDKYDEVLIWHFFGIYALPILLMIAARHGLTDCGPSRL
jgi:hypothetical protein